MKSEGTIQYQIIDAINSLGYLAERRVPYEGGMTDIVAAICGRWVAIEVKKENGRMEPLQEAYQKEVMAKGNLHFVCRSKEDAITIVKDIENGRYRDSLPTSV